MFSNSRPYYIRLLCLFLAALLLANSFFIPVKASVVDFLGFAAESVIASIVRACGCLVTEYFVDYVDAGIAGFETIVNSILDVLPEEYLYINAAGERFVKTIFQDGIYYVDRNLVEEVCRLLNSPLPTQTGEYYIPFGSEFDFDKYEIHLESLLTTLYRYGYKEAAYYRKFNIGQVIEFTYNDETIYSPVFIFSNTGANIPGYTDGSMGIEVNGPVLVFARQNKTQNTEGTPYIYYSEENIHHELRFPDISFIEGKAFYLTDVTVHGGSGGFIPSLRMENYAGSITADWDANSVQGNDVRMGGEYTALPLSISVNTSDAATSSRSEAQAGTKAEADSVVIPNSGTDTGTEVLPGTTTGILTEMLTAVKSLAVSITQPVSLSISSAVTAVTDFFKFNPDNLGFYSLPGLKDFFPFCIPFDLYAFMCVLCADPAAPIFTFACPLPGGRVYEVDIDLTAWDSVAETIRYCVIAIYIVSLANATRKMIRW